MRVIKGAYGNDEERWRAHVAKLVDPMEPVQRQHGRRLKLSTLLRLNGKGEKAGAGCDAPRWWQEGKYALPVWIPLFSNFSIPDKPNIFIH